MLRLWQVWTSIQQLPMNIRFLRRFQSVMWMQMRSLIFQMQGAVDELLDYCVEKTSGSPLYNRTVRRAACKGERSIRKIAVLKSANMSMGINLLLKLFKRCSKSTCTGRIRYGAC